MTIEMISLFIFLATFATLLLAQPLVLARFKGMGFVAGNRAEAIETEIPVTGRLSRTVGNSIEAAVLFIPLVLATQILGHSNTLTQWGAMIFAAARIVYSVLYPMGVVGLRSLSWNVGFMALAAIAIGLLQG